MTDGSRIARNFMFLSVAQVIGFAAGFGTTILLARNLGPSNYGVLGFGQAFIAFAGALAVVGTDVFGAREIAREPTRTGYIVSQILGLRGALFVVIYPLLLVLILLIDLPDQTSNVLIVQSLGVLIAAISIDFAFQGIQRMGVIAIRQSVSAMIVFTGVVLLVRSPDDIYLAAMLPVVALSIMTAWTIWRFHKTVAPAWPAADTTEWKRIALTALPIGLGGLGVAVFQQTDILMLGFLAAAPEVGLYVAMTRVYVVATTVGNLLAAAFLPALSELSGASQTDRRAGYRRFALSVFLLGGPICATLAVFPGETLWLFFGGRYVEEVGVFSVLMIAALVFLGTIVTGNALIAWNDEIYHMKALGAGAVINVVLNALLIPRLGLLGAAIATLISVACLFVFEVVRVWTRHQVTELRPFITIFGLLALVFGPVALIRQWVLPEFFIGFPVPTLLLVGGLSTLLFVSLAVAIRIVSIRQVVSTVYRRRDNE